MQELSESTPVTEETHTRPTAVAENVAPDPVVSTHVLVPEPQAEKLRELSRKTRVAQSEYLREAVDDVLEKYGKLPSEDE